MEEKIIIKIMHEKDQGLTITELVEISKLPRSAVRTALARLEGACKVSIRKIGMAKVYTLNHKKDGEHARIDRHHAAVPVQAIILIILIPIMMLLVAGMASSETIDVSKQKYLTDNQDYDRSPSIINTGTEYWLFFTKARHNPPAIRGPNYANQYYYPDQDNYTIFYKRAADIAGLADASEELLGLSTHYPVTNFNQRIISATYFHDKIYLFASSGYSDETDTLYYYVYDNSSNSSGQESGTQWAGPYMLLQNTDGPPELKNDSLPQARVKEVNVASDNDWMYIAWSDGSAGHMTTWNGTDYGTQDSPISPPDATNKFDLPKMTIMSGTIYLVGFKFGSRTQPFVYSAPAGPDPQFSLHSKVTADTGVLRPNIFSDGRNLYVVSSEPGDLSDHLIITRSDNAGTQWSTPKDVTYSSYDADNDHTFLEYQERWNDGDGAGYSDSTGTYIYFTTESDGAKAYSDAEIAYMNLDWNTDNNHYATIQNAISLASQYDTVKISEGTYDETLRIQNPISLVGIPSNSTGGLPTITSRGGAAVTILTDDTDISGLQIANSDYGIVISPEDNPDIYSPSIHISGNAIWNNTIAGISDDGAGILDARNNYWGNYTGPSGIGNGGGDAITGTISYNPWYADAELKNKIYQEVLDIMDSIEFSDIKNNNSDPENIKSDLSLMKQGPSNTAINWASSNTSIISNTGKVTRPDSDTEIYLLMIISKLDSTRLYKMFRLKVLAKEFPDQESVGNEYDALSFDDIKQDNMVESEVISDLNLITQGSEDTVIDWTSNDTRAISDTGTVIRGDNTTSVTLVANIRKGAYNKTKEFVLTVPGVYDADDDELASAKTALTDQLILNGNINARHVTSRLNLPTSLQGFEGLKISWGASPGVIGMDNPEEYSVLMDLSNSYSDTINSTRSIYRESLMDSHLDYGSFIGNGINFYCGKCAESNLSDPATEVGPETPFCGYDIDVISQMIHNGNILCAVDPESQKMYDIKIRSFSNSDIGCVDNDDGMCQAHDNRTSYIRTLSSSRGEVVRPANSDQDVVLTATLDLNGRVITRQYHLTIAQREASASYDSSGGIIYNNDSSEYIIDNSNSNNARNITVPNGVIVIMNLENLMNGNNTANLYKGLTLVRNGDNDTTFSIDILQGTSLFGGDLWNGIFMMPTIVDSLLYSIANGNVVRVLDIGWLYEFTFSNPVRIKLGGMSGKKAAYARSGYRLTNIDRRCTGASDPSNIINNGECYYDDGHDLIIWTYHLSKYAAYTYTGPSGIAGGSTGSSGQSPPKNNAGGGAGSFGGSALSTCTESWNCTSWSACNEFSVSTRACIDINHCGTINDEPAFTESCVYAQGGDNKDNFLTKAVNNVESAVKTFINNLSNITNPDTTDKRALFDIIIDILKNPTIKDKVMLAKISLINFGVSGNVDAKLIYTIKNSQDWIVMNYEKTVPVETQKEFIESINMSNLEAGKYKIIVELRYTGQKQQAITEKSFTIGDNSQITLIIPIALAVILIIGGYIFYKAHDGRKDREENVDESSGNNTPLSSFRIFKWFKTEKREEPKAKTAENSAIQDTGDYEKKTSNEDDNDVWHKVIDDDLLSHEAPSAQAFILFNGTVARSLKDLANLLKSMDDNTFSYHANSQKNDFSAWTKNVFHYDRLAEMMSQTKDRQGLIDLLDKKYSLVYRNC